MQTCNLDYIERTAQRHLDTKSVRLLAAAVIEQAVLDYRALVRRGVIVRGAIHWPYKVGYKVDNMTDRNDAVTALEFFAPGGHMEDLIYAAALEISPEMIRRQVGWVASDAVNN